jgi:hypothetical protein
MSIPTQVNSKNNGVIPSSNSVKINHSPLKIIGIVLGGLLAFAAMVGLIIGLVFSMGSAPMKASEQFLGLLSSNQIDQAYDSTSIQFRDAVSKDTFQAFLEQYPILKKEKKTSFTAFNVQNNTQATVGGTMTAADGQISPVSIQLVNENEQWRVLNIDLNPPVVTTTVDTSSTDLD